MLPRLLPPGLRGHQLAPTGRLRPHLMSRSAPPRSH